MNRIHALIAAVIFLLAGCASAPLFTVETDPVGADIFVDGIPAGKTPAAIKVKFAENTQMVMEKKILVVKLPGYKEKREVISHDGTKALKFQLSPDHVESAPFAAAVISKPSATSEQENQAGIKAEIASEPSVTSGQKDEAALKPVIAGEPSVAPE
jgi:hypothetical protein